MKYLRKFETEAEYNAAEKSPAKNYVSIIAETGSIKYDKSILEGVYIQHIDGNLYTTDDWTAGGFPNEQANGVAVIASQCGFVVAKDNIAKSAKWYSSALAVDGLFTATSEDIALADYNGVVNTQVIASVLSSGAAYSCKEYIFPNGSNGYLPALGELAVMRNNITLINSAMLLVGGATIAANSSSYKYWSSTQGGDTTAWFLFAYSSYGVLNSSKTDTAYIRAFAAL